MTKTPVLYGLLSMLIWGIISCNHHLDAVKSERKLPISDGDLGFYPDSNVLNFRSRLGIRLDTEHYSPRSFYAKLPKGIKSWDISIPYWFVFYYDKDQAIAIDIDYHHLDANQYSTYIPDESGIDSVNNATLGDGSKKYDIRRIQTGIKRKSLIIRNGPARILLYNIRPGNYDRFVTCLREFKMLD